VLEDVRHTFRVLRGNPGVSSAALVALALGIGANTVIFSLMDAVVFRPLPYPQPERLMTVAATERGRGMNTSWAMFQDWQTQTREFEHLAAYTGGSPILTGAGEPVRVDAAYITAEMFAVLGTSPLVGTLDSTTQTAVISYGFWTRRFGGDHKVLGQTLILDGKPYFLAGVLPNDFRFPRWAMMEEPDVYLPVMPNPSRRTHYLRAIGRLKPGVTLAQARADMDAISAAIERADPRGNRGEGATVTPLSEDLTSGTRQTLTAFSLAVVIVLIIACVNVSNLLLSQGARRQREIAIRAALGASRMRLVKQFLVESLVLSVCGGTAGVLLALWGMQLLMAAVPAHTAMSTRVEMSGVGLNWTVLGFAIGLSAITALLFGLLPAWRASFCPMGPDRSAALLGSRSLRGGRVRGILIAAEVGLSLVLLTSAGLLINSLLRLLSVNPGFNTRNLITIDVELPQSKYAEVEQRARFVRNGLARLESIPGVRAAAAINAMPLTKSSAWNSFNLPGSSQELGQAGFRTVTPGYFEAMEIPLIRGRLLTRGDTSVGVVNQAMVRRYWPNEDPIGKVIETSRVVRMETPHGWTMRFIPEQFRIVGVVGDVRHLALDDEPQPEMFLLYSQMATSDFTFVLRSSLAPALLARAARREILAVDHDQPLAAVRTMDQLISQDVACRRFVMLLLIVFAATAVALAASGIFAVVAQSVSQRAREIAIRMALGADRTSIIRTMVGQTFGWIGTGLLAGTGGTWIAGRSLASYLYSVRPRDPATLAAAVTVLAVLALLAAFIPARNAARVDPATSLQCE